MQRFKNTYLLLYLTVCVCLLTACSKSYPGVEYPYEEGDYVQNAEADFNTPVVVNLSDPALLAVTTRGSGAIDKDVKLNEVKFRAFAFRDDPNVDMTVDIEDDPDKENCLISGTGDMGMPLRAQSNEPEESTGEAEFYDEENNKQTLYYSYKNQEIGYNFFAYFLDDINPTAVHREKGRIAYDIEIDGSNDLLYGYAPKLTYNYVYSRLLESGYEAGSMLEDIVQEQIKNVLNFGYSAYSSHRGINPVIDLKHALTRLTFKAYPGDKKTAEGQDPNDVKIIGVEFITKKQATFIVAHTDTNALGLMLDELAPDDHHLFLRDDPDDAKFEPYAKPARKDGLPFESTIEEADSCLKDYVVNVLPGEENKQWWERTPVDVGESMMLFPSEEIKLIIYYEENFPEDPNNIKQYYTEKTITPPTNHLDSETGKPMFLAGKSYSVSIAVYGLQRIDVGVNVAPWESGGDVEIVPEGEPNRPDDW